MFACLEKLRCFFLCKDTKFKANHDGDMSEFPMQIDVFSCAKIRNLKQITTAAVSLYSVPAMFFLVQRYEI